MDAAGLSRASALAREHADEGEEERRLAQPVSDALRDARVFAMLIPASLGGGEVSLEQMIEALEALGRADGSAGWCAMVGATAGLSLAWLEPDAAAEVFPTVATVVCGVFAPRGRAARDGDRLIVSGRWPFASNVERSEWVLGGTVIEDEPASRLVLMPRERVQVIDTWHVAGLRGTGSSDFSVEGLSVPATHAANVAERPLAEGPLYRFPLMATLALGIAAVALGIAAAAVEDMIELAAAKVPTGSRRRLAEREVVQGAIARAHGEVGAGRAFLLEQARAGWAEADRDGEVSLERRASLRLAATHAVSAAVRATDEVFAHAGASAVYQTSTLQRRFRDIHVAAQHMMVAPPTYELAGRAALGLEVEGRGL